MTPASPEAWTEPANADLIAFLNARLDEDEMIAEAAGGSSPQGVWAQVDPDRRPGRIDCDSGYVVTYDEGSPDNGQAPHIARHDPARALREVAFKRSILGQYQTAAGWSGDNWPLSLRLLAAIWSNNPDYQQEWKP